MFIRFLNAIKAEIPVGKIIHVVLDNYATHKHPQGEGLAGAASALRLPLHPEIVLLAQHRRDPVLEAHPPTAQARRVPLNRRTPGRHQPLPRGKPMPTPSPLSGRLTPTVSSPPFSAGCKY
jgi:hypothetical protein